MSLTLTQHKNGTHNTGSTCDCTVTALGSGHLIVVAVGWLLDSGNNLGTLDSVTDGTNTYTRFTSSKATCQVDIQTINNHSTEFFYCLSSTSGPTTITAHFSNSPKEMNVEVWEVAPNNSETFTTDTTNVVNNTLLGGTSNIAGASVTTGTTLGFVAGIFMGVDASASANPHSGNEFTAGGDISGLSGTGNVSLIYSTAAAHQPAWDTDISTGYYCASTTSFTASGGGGGPTVKPLAALGVG